MKNSLANSLIRYFFGILLVCGLGALLVLHPYGEGLRRLSYDLLFDNPVYGEHETTNLADDYFIVYLDELSHKMLDQPYDRPWDRRLHADLLNRLTEEGAKLVFYDIVFEQRSSNEASDTAFEEAIAKNGAVVLGAGIDRQEGEQSSYEEIIHPPYGRFRRGAKAWGMIFSPIDPDQGIRILATGTENIPSATWKTALLIAPGMDKILGPRRQEQRWLNYLGPPNHIPSASFSRALLEDELPKGFFKDKVVFLGLKESIGLSGSSKDSFRSPYGGKGRHSFYAGVELHVAALDNLLQANWFTPITKKSEVFLILGIGLILVLCLTFLRPRNSFLCALGAALVLALLSPYLCRSTGHFFSWLIPPFFLAPTAFLWSAGCHYYVEVRKRNRLRRTFSAYLSPVMVKRMAESDEDPELGGHEESITAFFSDVVSFSSFSEGLNPTQLTEVMNTYLTEMTNILQEYGGTLDKYIGDAIVAMFGAPLEMEDHAAKACFTAARMQERLAEIREEWSDQNNYLGAVLGRLHTRIGLNSGTATVGNIGSEFRLNYTMMGDMVNLAARCESGAKSYGAFTLVTEATKTASEKDSSDFVFRLLDRVIVKGRQEPVALYELMGFNNKQPESTLECLQTYNLALEKYIEQDWAGAITLLQKSAGLEPFQFDEDGEKRITPSTVLHNRCQEMKENPPAKDWGGVYVMTSK